VVLLLVKLGADVKSPYRNWTPLQRAAFLIDPEIVNILMANGAYVVNNTNSEDNDPDSEGERYRPLEERPSPLHYAVACGNHSTAKALIEGGINIDVRNIQKMTPLLAACEMAPQGNAKGPESIRFITAKMLISYGADICATNGQGSNALHLAVEARPLDVHTIRFLLQSGVNVNAKDSQDSTPFHVFCGGSIAGFGTKAETEEVFELLLAHAPPGIVNMERQGGSTVKAGYNGSGKSPRSSLYNQISFIAKTTLTVLGIKNHKKRVISFRISPISHATQDLYEDFDTLHILMGPPRFSKSCSVTGL